MSLFDVVVSDDNEQDYGASYVGEQQSSAERKRGMSLFEVRLSGDESDNTDGHTQRDVAEAVDDVQTTDNAISADEKNPILMKQWMLCQRLEKMSLSLLPSLLG